MTFSRITGVQGTPVNIPTGVASSGAGNVTVRKFSFAYNTPGLLAGTAAVYTPTIGDVLMDAWVSITTPWNGTTPLFDFGQDLVANTGGFYAQLTNGLFHPYDATPPTFYPHMDFGDLSTLDTVGGTRQPGQLTSIAQIGGLAVTAGNLVDFNGTPPLSGDGLSWTTSSPLQATGSPARFVVAPSVFVSADPIQISVSRSGIPGGADPGSTQGAATLYLAISTPA